MQNSTVMDIDAEEHHLVLRPNADWMLGVTIGAVPKAIFF